MIVDKVAFSYKNGVEVFEDISLNFEKNKIYSIVGPSGCGKTTLFKLLVGIEHPLKGKILYEKEDSHSVMMQTDTLFPWYTVKDNIRLGFELTNGTGVYTETLIDDYLVAFQLEDFKNAFPQELSAGMKQRVQMIQSMIGETKYLFLDEPFSNLDFDVKLRIQSFLKEKQKEIKNTLVIITHDIEDAIALSNQVIVLSAKPVRIVDMISIEIDNSDPVAVRSNPLMADYFSKVWSLLKLAL
jgi:NitT/TauT family transport system ATP-binding protein